MKTEQLINRIIRQVRAYKPKDMSFHEFLEGVTAGVVDMEPKADRIQVESIIHAATKQAIIERWKSEKAREVLSAQLAAYIEPFRERRVTESQPALFEDEPKGAGAYSQ